MTAPDNQTVSYCVSCGTEIKGNKGKKWCSGKCRMRYSRKQQPKKPRPIKINYKDCEWCGNQFVCKRKIQRFCSKSCTTLSRAEEIKEANKQRRSKTIQCKTCNQMFSRSESDSSIYCSDQCKSLYRSLTQCEWCDRLFDNSGTAKKYCSDDCMIKARRQRDTDKRVPRTIQWEQRQCKLCNKSFYANAARKRKYCTEYCSGKAAKLRRRAKKKKQFVEDVNIGLLYKRDKGNCQLCGRKVNRDVDWNHPLAPTIDHIIPICAGGKHSYKNTQLAHRHCNTKKGSKILNL